MENYSFISWKTNIPYVWSVLSVWHTTKLRLSFFTPTLLLQPPWQPCQVERHSMMRWCYQDKDTWEGFEVKLRFKGTLQTLLKFGLSLCQLWGFNLWWRGRNICAVPISSDNNQNPKPTVFKKIYTCRHNYQESEKRERKLWKHLNRWVLPYTCD